MYNCVGLCGRTGKKVCEHMAEENPNRYHFSAIEAVEVNVKFPCQCGQREL